MLCGINDEYLLRDSSFVFSSGKKILFRDMPSRLAKLLQNLFVSQFVSVIRATVNLPRESKLIDVDISSTLKSETRAFKTPPIPVVLVAYPSSPMARATGSELVILIAFKD